MVSFFRHTPHLNANLGGGGGGGGGGYSPHSIWDSSEIHRDLQENMQIKFDGIRCTTILDAVQL